LQCHFVATDVDALLFFEFTGQILDQPQVEVLAAQVGIAVGGFDFKNTFADFQNGYIEGAATQVENRNFFFLFFVEAVRQRSRSGFVDDTQHIQSGDFAGVFRGLTLAVVEIGRNRNDGIGDGFSEVIFGGFLDVGQNIGRDFRRTQVLVPDIDPNIPVAGFFEYVWKYLDVSLYFRCLKFAADQPFYGKNGILGIGDSLAFGNLADQTFAAF